MGCGKTNPSSKWHKYRGDLVGRLFNTDDLIRAHPCVRSYIVGESGTIVRARPALFVGDDFQPVFALARILEGGNFDNQGHRFGRDEFFE